MYFKILKYCSFIDKQHYDKNQIHNELAISFAQLNEYLLTLQQAGLLEIDHYNETIKTTMKGQEFITRFEYLSQQSKDNRKMKD